MPPSDEMNAKIRVVFDSGPFRLLYEKAKISAKAEVHSIWHCRQKMTQPRPLVTCREILVKFGRVVFETCEQTNRQTNRHADHNTSPPYWGELMEMQKWKVLLMQHCIVTLYEAFYGYSRSSAITYIKNRQINHIELFGPRAGPGAVSKWLTV